MTEDWVIGAITSLVGVTVGLVGADLLERRRERRRLLASTSVLSEELRRASRRLISARLAVQANYEAHISATIEGYHSSQFADVILLIGRPDADRVASACIEYEAWQAGAPDLSIPFDLAGDYVAIELARQILENRIVLATVSRALFRQRRAARGALNAARRGLDDRAPGSAVGPKN